MRYIKATGIDAVDLADEQAVSDYVYDQLIPKLESKGILLSSYGNHAGQRALVPADEYYTRKQDKGSFEISKIVEEIPRLPGKLSRTDLNSASYELRASVVGRGFGKYIANGDFIVAMLLRGYGVSFAMEVNCHFQNPKQV
jgi:hypothetical protein